MESFESWQKGVDSFPILWKPHPNLEMYWYFLFNSSIRHEFKCYPTIGFHPGQDSSLPGWWGPMEEGVLSFPCDRIESIDNRHTFCIPMHFCIRGHPDLTIYKTSYSANAPHRPRWMYPFRLVNTSCKTSCSPIPLDRPLSQEVEREKYRCVLFSPN